MKASVRRKLRQRVSSSNSKCPQCRAHLHLAAIVAKGKVSCGVCGTPIEEERL